MRLRCARHLVGFYFVALLTRRITACLRYFPYSHRRHDQFPISSSSVLHDRIGFASPHILLLPTRVIVKKRCFLGDKMRIWYSYLEQGDEEEKAVGVASKLFKQEAR